MTLSGRTVLVLWMLLALQEIRNLLLNSNTEIDADPLSCNTGSSKSCSKNSNLNYCSDRLGSRSGLWLVAAADEKCVRWGNTFDVPIDSSNVHLDCFMDVQVQAPAATTTTTTTTTSSTSGGGGGVSTKRYPICCEALDNSDQSSMVDNSNEGKILPTQFVIYNFSTFLLFLITFHLTNLNLYLQNMLND